jgi:general secretion pathway protein D
MSFLRPIAALGLAGITTGLAQPPEQPLVTPQPPAQPAVPAPPGQPAVPAVPAVPGQPAPPPAPPAAGEIPLAEQKITQAITEPKLTGTALADLYRKFTGRRVIISAQASTAEFSFIQDASPTDPLTYAEAAELLKKAATIENFVFVPDSTDPNLDILTFSAGGINPKSRGVPVYTEGAALPDGDAVISYVMNLQYLKPEAAVTTFNQVVGTFGQYGSIAPVANASAVIITENTSLIRRLIELKKEIDVPGGKVATRFVKVEYADVTELAATLNELFTSQQQAQRTAGVQRTGGQPNAAPVPGMPAVDGGGGGGTGGEENPPQIVPEPRTNRIFVMGRPNDLVFIESLVREFDIQTDQRNFMRRKLSFVKVADFLDIAENALTRAYSAGTAGGATGGAPGGPQAQGGGGQSRGQGSRTNSNSRTASSGGGASGTGSSSGFGGGGGGGGGGSGGSVGLGEANADTAPVSLLVGRTLLVADQITNSIVVQGPPAGVEIIENLLDQIDVKADQVMISTVFGQLTLTKDFDLGVDYLRTLNGGVAGRAGGGDATALIPLGPATVGGVTTTPLFQPGTLSGGGLSIYGRIGNNLNIYLNALQGDSNFTILSRPSIFTSNNQKGIISSGERVAIPTNSNSFSSGGQSTNIEYQDVVLKLEVIPLVNSPNEITLQIALLNDELNGNQILAGAGPNGAALSVPRITTREILTQVTVPNNETIVLGGLIIDRDTKSVSGVPVLSSIPGLGRLFSRTETEKSRSELLIFIQPSIVSGQNSLDVAQDDMNSRYKVSGDVLKMGNGPGVLPPPDVIPVSDKATTTPRAVIIGPRTQKKNPFTNGRHRGASH